MRLDKTSTIAIVIPVYNAEQYLSDCLNSLLAQSFCYWRAYCVNDGSQDSSGKILDDYAKKDDRFLVFHIPNSGASAARNYALDQLKDEIWVSFIDADDYVSPSMYATIINAVGEESVEYVRLFSQRTVLRYGEQNNWNDNSICKKMVVSMPDYFCHSQVGGYTHSLFISSNLIKQYNLRFPANMRLLEDQAFSILCASFSKRIMILQEPQNYYYYIGNECSITQQKKNCSDDIVRCINNVYAALENTGNKNLLRDYFYTKFLPRKLDILLRQRMRNGNRRIRPDLGLKFYISVKEMPVKCIIKYILCKVLFLL